MVVSRRSAMSWSVMYDDNGAGVAGAVRRRAVGGVTGIVVEGRTGG